MLHDPNFWKGALVGVVAAFVLSFLVIAVLVGQLRFIR